MDLVTIYDYLKAFDMGERDYTASDGYNAYRSIKSGASAYQTGKDYGISYHTCYQWACDKRKPIYVNQIEALESLSLMPLKSDSKLLPLFKELFAYCFFSGNVNKDSNSNSAYYIELSDSRYKGNKLVLELNGELLKSSFGVNYEIREKEIDNVIYHSMRLHSENYLISAMARLMLLSGMPLGEKGLQNINSPELIDDDLMLFFGIKLRGLSGKTGFYLWAGPKEVAKQNLDNFLTRINKIYPATGYLHDHNLDSGYYIPEIHIPTFKSVLNTYRPLLTI